MRKINVISRVHDDMIFYFTLEAFYSGEEEIGFYFDMLGRPQRICKNSVYGKMIERYVEDLYDDFKYKE